MVVLIWRGVGLKQFELWLLALLLAALTILRMPMDDPFGWYLMVLSFFVWVWLLRVYSQKKLDVHQLRRKRG